MSESVFALPTAKTRRKSLSISLAQIGLWSVALVVNMTQDLPMYVWPFLMLLQSFLFVGLFIVAHDCMHGLVGSESGRASNILGRICAFLFAGFSYDKLKDNHTKHHNFLATHEDPDYTKEKNENFFVWLKSFIFRYFGLKEFFVLHIHVVGLYLLSGSFLKVLIFFAIPSWIASLQLFYFGTYKPHRNFINTQTELKARSNNYHILLSFFTCYHFGYHREHHKYPHLTWWQLPRAYKQDKNKCVEST